MEFSDFACLIVRTSDGSGNLAIGNPCRTWAQLGRSAVRITDCIYVYNSISVVHHVQTRFLLPVQASFGTLFIENHQFFVLKPTFSLENHHFSALHVWIVRCVLLWQHSIIIQLMCLDSLCSCHIRSICQRPEWIQTCGSCRHV